MLKKHQQGLSLIELLIAILVGLFVAGAAISIYIVSLQSSSHTMTIVKLSQELRSAMSLMTSDIRRSGFWAGPTNRAVSTALPNFPHSTLLINGARNCILYSYDINSSGEPNPANVNYFGFRRNGMLLQTYNGDSTGCNAASTDNRWTGITDNSLINIEQLEFRTVAPPNGSSRCVNLTTNINWELQNTDTAAATQACNATNATATGTFVAPATGDLLYESRLINIRIRGSSIRDPSIVIELNETVKPMNDRVLIAP